MPVTSYLNQSVSWKAKAGFDGYGKPTTSTPVTISCRIQGSTKKLVNEAGDQYVADAEMWVAPTQTLEMDDVIVWESSNYKVVKVEVKKNLSGATNHKKAYLVRTKQ